MRYSIFTSILFLVIFCSCKGPDVESPSFVSNESLEPAAVEPDPRIRYKEASPELNTRAIQLLETKLNPANDFDIASQVFGEAIICPAGLLEQIRNEDGYESLSVGEDYAVIHGRIPVLHNGQVVKMISLEGRFFSSEKARRWFWQAFRSKLNLHGKPTVRKLNQLEKNILWAMIAWGIDEPVFICDWDNHKILVDMSEDLKIVYIDELQPYINGDMLK